jgi:hypothetical protein
MVHTPYFMSTESVAGGITMNSMDNIIALRKNKNHFDLDMTCKVIKKMENLGYSVEEDVRYFLENSEYQLIFNIQKTYHHIFKTEYYPDKEMPLHSYKPLQLAAYDFALPFCEEWLNGMKMKRDSLVNEIEEQIKIEVSKKKKQPI